MVHTELGQNKCSDQKCKDDKCRRSDGYNGGMFLGLGFLGEKGGDELNNLDDGWMDMEITVDSGACDTVIPAECGNHIKVHTPAGGKKHPGYEAANGTNINHVGERRCLVSTEGSNGTNIMHFQVADIRKPLLSISKVADMGFECVLGKNGGYLMDTHNGERIPIQRKGNLYDFKLWVKDATKSFGGQE